MLIPITRPELPPLDSYVELLRGIWDSRMLSNFGTHARQLEAIAARYLGVHARVTVNGDVGLACAIAALRIPPGSTCLVPSFTFNSTINAVLWNDLVPVFVDADPETFNMDPAAARAAPAECEPRLIVATHVFGNPADAPSLWRLASDCGARLLFDAAHAYGSMREGVMVGGLGDAEVFSLSGTKPVTCAEGGLVTSRDPEFMRRLEYVRAYGFQADYDSQCQGLNGKMSELHAALGTLTLPTIEAVLARRLAQVAHYRRRLQGIPGLRFQHVREVDRSTYKDFAVVFASADDRARAEQALAERGIQTKRYFRPCHTMTAFWPLARGPLPVTEDLYERVLCLPLFAALTETQIDHIAAVIEQAVAPSPARG